MAELLLPSGSGQGGIDPDELTATAADVIKGKIAGVNGSDEPIEGTLEVQSVINFNVAQYSSLTLLASWALPAKGPWSGLRIMCKQGDYPSSPQDGTLFYEGSAASAIKALAAGTWYFRAWNYMFTNYGRIYGNYLDQSASNVQIKGLQVFTGSTTWYVPAGVRSLDIFTVGGGGGAGAASYNYDSYEVTYSEGGGSGFTATHKSLSVNPGTAVYVYVGQGGVGGRTMYYDGAPGGASYVTINGANYAYSRGGNYPSSKYIVGNGGSGGGVGYSAAPGGYDGSNGFYWTGTQVDSNRNSNQGQKRTTRAFGEASNTLYAGGGGGGSGPGGPGGGGAGGINKGNPGASGTGGGGGGTECQSGTSTGGNGGSGIVIIRWGY